MSSSSSQQAKQQSSSSPSNQRDDPVIPVSSMAAPSYINSRPYLSMNRPMTTSMPTTKYHYPVSSATLPSIGNAAIKSAHKLQQVRLLAKISALTFFLFYLQSWFLRSTQVVTTFTKEQRHGQRVAKITTALNDTLVESILQENLQVKTKSAIVVYAVTDPEKTAMALTHRLAVHAYAHSHNLTYGGACFVATKKGGKSASTTTPSSSLSQALGLDHLLATTTPTPECPKKKKNQDPSPLLLTHDSAELKDLVWSHWKLPAAWISESRQPSDDPFRIAVHVPPRRPCPKKQNPQTKDDDDYYLPNAYFLQQIQRAVKDAPRNTNINVTIYATTTSEDTALLAELEQHNYTIVKIADDRTNHNNDAKQSLQQILHDMTTAHVLIAAHDDYSLLPALVRSMTTNDTTTTTSTTTTTNEAAAVAPKVDQKSTIVVVAPPQFPMALPPNWQRAAEWTGPAACEVVASRRRK